MIVSLLARKSALRDVFLILTISALALWALKDYIPVNNDDAENIELVPGIRDSRHQRSEEETHGDGHDSSVQTTRSANGSVFKHASAFFYFMACIAVLIYVILLTRGVLYSDEDAHEENNRPAILMIACGCCFLVHTLCWIKATFQLEGAED